MKICPKCAAENTDTAKFCNECGSALEIKETEHLENASDPEPAPEKSKEEITPEENSESSKVEEPTTDIQEAVAEQTQKKEEPASKKKNRVVIGVVAAAIICIIGFIATRPKLESIEVTYSGDTSDGIVLDNKNDGFSVKAIYSDGKEETVPQGEWQIESPETLECDGSKEVTVAYKDISQNITIECTSTKLVYISAKYNGSTVDGTVVDSDSDIQVFGNFKNHSTQEFENWHLDPESVTLKEGKTSKLTVKIYGDDGITYSTRLEITGTEKPFTNPEIEGDHYNCTPEQFKKYTNTHSNLTLKETTSKYFDGDDYTSYIATSTSSSIEPTGLALRTNEDGKVCSMIVIAKDGSTGIAESLNYAAVFDKSIDLDDRSKMADLILYKVYNTDNTVIVMDNNTVEDGYLFYIMTKEYFDNNFKQ